MKLLNKLWHLANFLNNHLFMASLFFHEHPWWQGGWVKFYLDFDLFLYSLSFKSAADSIFSLFMLWSFSTLWADFTDLCPIWYNHLHNSYRGLSVLGISLLSSVWSHFESSRILPFIWHNSFCSADYYCSIGERGAIKRGILKNLLVNCCRM